MSKELEVMHAGEDGWSDWIHPLPGYLMGCCDCGLVHDFEFAIIPQHAGIDGPLNKGETKNRVIIFRAKRHE